MSISCQEAQRAIPWLLDDELEPVQTLEMEAHLQSCEECRAQFEADGHLLQTLRRAADSVVAPASLRRRVQKTLDREDRRSSWVSQWVPAAAAAAILLSFIWRGGVGLDLPELDEVTRRHTRNLPMDVEAASVAQVQSYFADKLPFAVRLPELQEEPEPVRPPLVATPAPAMQPQVLLGGRIMQLRNREAAYVRYNMSRGRLSVFVYEDPGFAVPEGVPIYRVSNRRVALKRVRGYTVARWKASGLVYFVVTDLPEAETSVLLQRIVR